MTVYYSVKLYSFQKVNNDEVLGSTPDLATKVKAPFYGLFYFGNKQYDFG